MAYPATPAELAAIEQLANGYYNNGPVSPSNPGGFDNGGYITNLHEANGKTALVATFVGDAADVVVERADRVEELTEEAAGYVGKMSGTSASAVEIGEGLKTFATQAGKFFEPGRDIKIVSAANPNSHWFSGTATGYSGLNLTIDVTDFEGIGTRSDWIIYSAGRPGDAGTIMIDKVIAGRPDSAPTVVDKGTESAAVLDLTIPVGRPAGLPYTWSASATASDPGPGKIKVSASSLTVATELYISETDRDGVAVAAEIASWDDSSSAMRGVLRIVDLANPANFVSYAVIDAITDNGGWDRIPVVHIDHGGTIADGARLIVQFRGTGQKGTAGLTAYEVAVDAGFQGTLLQWLASLDGQDGAAATVSVGSVTTTAPGSPAVVAEAGTPAERILNFSLPRGDQGPVGPPPALVFTFDGGVANSDPGNGRFRINAPVYADATTLYIDNLDAFGSTVADWLDSLDDSTNVTSKGELTLVQIDSPARFAKFKVVGQVVDATGFRRVPVVHIASSGTLAGRVAVQFSRTGDGSAAGDGTGDVIGPDEVAVGAFAVFVTADGKQIGPTQGGFNGSFTTLTDKPEAVNIPFEPIGTIAATDVQAAIAELGTEKSQVGHQHAAGDTTSGTFDLARLPVAGSGTSDATKVVRADDSRLSNARTPTAHDQPISTITGLSGVLADKADSAAVAAALTGKADLVGGVILESQIPAVAITDVYEAASQAAMLALTAQRGDVAVRSDINKTFMLRATPATTLSNWSELRTPTDAVLSIAGKTGAVTLVAADISDASADGRALFQAANYATMRTLLGLGIGTDVQAYDSDLAAIAALTTAAFGRSLLTLADATALRTAAGVGSAALLTAGTAANNAVQLNASGQLPAVSGALLTNLPSSSPPSTAGAIGTYALALYNAASLSFGATVAGSTLTPSNGNGSPGGSALSGTWRCMGGFGGETAGGRTTSFVRIS